MRVRVILVFMGLLLVRTAAAQTRPPGNSDVRWEPFPILPMVWWNDATDLTVGVWMTSGPTALGSFTVSPSRGFGGFQAATIGDAVDFFVRLEDPPFLKRRGVSGGASAWARDGTVGARLEMSRPNSGSRGWTETGAKVEWVATRETGYLDPALWGNAGTVEGTVFHARHWSVDGWEVGIRGEAGGGGAYRFRERRQSGSRYVTTPYGRAWAEASMRRGLGPLVVGARGYVGGVTSGDPVPLQRRIAVKGADPYQTLGNPLVRAEGAPFVNGDLLYHSPGHANLRGYQPGISGRWAAAVNLELEADIVRTGGPLRRVSLVGFWDGGLLDTLAFQAFTGESYRAVVDAGVGARVWLDVGGLSFPIRVEFPFYVSEPTRADDRRRGTDQVEFRWLISLQPIF